MILIFPIVVLISVVLETNYASVDYLDYLICLLIHLILNHSIDLVKTRLNPLKCLIFD